MKEARDLYWAQRIKACQESFERNNFNVFTVNAIDEAQALIRERILPKLSFKTVSWGDSLSMMGSGIIRELENDPEVRLIKTFEAGVPREELIERRRQALLADLFFTGSNAITESGQLVNLDMVGNRVAALTFGPRHVVVVVGRNKIVAGLDQATERVRTYAAPLNAIRHTGWKTPCAKTGVCSDCSSPDRICNTWTITEKSYPKGRISIIIVNQDLGL